MWAEREFNLKGAYMASDLSSGLHSATSSMRESAVPKFAGNIANSGSYGYKEVDSQFAANVASSGSATKQSAGGVSSADRRLIHKQGELEHTGEQGDIAIDGQGMLIVSKKSDPADPDKSFLFTRLGSFMEDKQGYFKTRSDYFLYAWPVDNDGRLPGEEGNLNTTPSSLTESLEPVNVRAVSSAAAATTKIDFGISLQSSTKAFEGAGQIFKLLDTSAENKKLGSDELIIPNVNMRQGDALAVTTPTIVHTFTYGGIETSSDISVGIFGANTIDSIFSSQPLAGQPLTEGDGFSITTASLGAKTFTYKASSPSTTKGEFNSLKTLATAIDYVLGLRGRAQGNNLYVAPDKANEGMTFTNINTTGTPSNIATMLGLTNTANAPTGVNRFATLASLGELVEESPGIGQVTETPSNSATMKIFNEDPTGTIKYSHHVSVTSNNLLASHFGVTDLTTPYASGVADGDNFQIQTRDLSGAIQGTYVFTYRTAPPGGTTTEFNDHTELMNRINTHPNLEAYFDNNRLIVRPTDPNLQMVITDNTGTIAGTMGIASTTTITSHLLTEFNITPAGIADQGTGPSYDPEAKVVAGVTNPNMANGKANPQYPVDVQVIDALGTRHDFTLGFIKVAMNTWQAELYTKDKSDIITSRNDGQVATGRVVFNGDGTLRSVEKSLKDALKIQWHNGAAESTIVLNWGTEGEAQGTPGASQYGKDDGLKQINTPSSKQFVNQNGVQASLKESIIFDADGYIVAKFQNGLSRRLYKIPLADFPNVDGLTAVDGNAFAATQDAGEMNLKEPGKNGVGFIKPGKLEKSTVELSDQLTRSVIAQRQYEASAHMVGAINELMKQLNRLFN